MTPSVQVDTRTAILTSLAIPVVWTDALTRAGLPCASVLTGTDVTIAGGVVVRYAFEAELVVTSPATDIVLI